MISTLSKHTCFPAELVDLRLFGDSGGDSCGGLIVAVSAIVVEDDESRRACLTSVALPMYGCSTLPRARLYGMRRVPRKEMVCCRCSNSSYEYDGALCVLFELWYLQRPFGVLLFSKRNSRPQDLCLWTLDGRLHPKQRS
uniref:Uncharacterized protein n=1 Tax=Craspedostauros australis TaxID=1486917 RepID=A0A7R9WV76_9STRA